MMVYLKTLLLVLVSINQIYSQEFKCDEHIPVSNVVNQISKEQCKRNIMWLLKKLELRSMDLGNNYSLPKDEAAEQN